jgi:DNA-binding beta-propeller fold protein YncE
MHAVSGSCSCLFSYCFTSYSHKWVVYDSVPLPLGENVIEAKILDSSGNTATDSTTITHPSLYGPTDILVHTANNELFVSYYNYIGSGIVVYDRSDSGYATPKRTITGSSTGLGAPRSLATDAGGEVLATNIYSQISVTAHVLTDAGNVAPSRTIVGATTGLNAPYGLAVDPENEEIFVSNLSSNSITVYQLMASGDVAPNRTLAGDSTELNGPLDIALDKINNEIFVANNSSSSITVYSLASNGNAAPIRSIGGTSTGLDRPLRVVSDTDNGELYVINCCNNTILVFALNASGDTAPIRTLVSSGKPEGIAVDTINNELFVTESEFSINVYPRTANGNVTPIRTIN